MLFISGSRTVKKKEEKRNLCRMLAIIPKEGSHVDSKVVRSFQKLASCGLVKPGSKPGHGDGWGIVAWKGGKPFYLARRPQDAFTDPEYEKACDKIDSEGISSPLIVHFRKASLGEKSEGNTHPFIIDEWAFAHNGTIRKQNLKNTTDSEWFFKSLMQTRRSNQSDMPDAINLQIESVKQVYNYSSLTFLLSNGNEFFAYRDSSGDYGYYTMYYTVTKDATIFCQEKLFDSAWKELQNEELVVLESTGAYPKLMSMARKTA